MPISISGSGTITGISAGGLPDGCITTDEIAANAVTAGKIGTTEQSRMCRAWVNFDGTGTVAIRASYNVSSITDNGVGDYTVNFTTAMPDANYCVAASGGAAAGGSPVPLVEYNQTAPSTTAVRLLSWYMTGTSGQSASDTLFANVAIFR